MIYKEYFMVLSLKYKFNLSFFNIIYVPNEYIFNILNKSCFLTTVKGWTQYKNYSGTEDIFDDLFSEGSIARFDISKYKRNLIVDKNPEYEKYLTYYIKFTDITESDVCKLKLYLE